MKNVSKLAASLILAMFTTVAIAGPNPSKVENAPDLRSNIANSLWLNVVDLMPFLFTTGISVLTGKMQPKEGQMNANAGLAFVLKHAAIAIPSAVAVANAYGRVATIRDSRVNFAENDVEGQNALTKQQDQVLANYAVTVPLSIVAASRLATSDDAAARIGYIVGSYLLASGEKSPFAYVKGYIASGLDSFRLDKTNVKSEK